MSHHKIMYRLNFTARHSRVAGQGSKQYNPPRLPQIHDYSQRISDYPARNMRFPLLIVRQGSTLRKQDRYTTIASVRNGLEPT